MRIDAHAHYFPVEYLEHLLMGTDYPCWRGNAFQLCVDYVSESGLPEKVVEDILGGNAGKLLRL